MMFQMKNSINANLPITFTVLFLSIQIIPKLAIGKVSTVYLLFLSGLIIASCEVKLNLHQVMFVKLDISL